MTNFFQILEVNEGPNFHLFFDDLPIYYVPSKYKDKLYLMANLFTKWGQYVTLIFIQQNML